MKSFFKIIVVTLLTFEAKSAIHRRKPFVIGVTGSVGKTSAKDAIAFMLTQCDVDHAHEVRASAKSFNSEIGIPLTILGISNAWNHPLRWLINLSKGVVSSFSHHFPKTLVLEIGADHPGDISRTMQWLKPDIAVLTRLPDTPVHVEYFSGPEEVKKEKSELVRALRPDGVYVANADDPEVIALASLTSARVVSYGFSDRADVRGMHPVIAYEEREGITVPVGMNVDVLYDERKYSLHLRGVLGEQSCLAPLAALAVGVALGKDMTAMVSVFEHFDSPRGRMRLISGIGNTTIIDDTYNSSPVACEAALSALRAVYGKHKIALLGDMLELGTYAQEAHWKVGRIAGGFVDQLVVVGARAAVIAEAAKTAGLPEAKIMICANSQEAGEWMRSRVNAGDVILAKGSQGSGANMIRMERAVKVLMLHPEHASELLVRQEPEWLAQYAS